VGANWDFGYGSGLPRSAHNPELNTPTAIFDIRQRLTFHSLYAIPGRKGYGQALEGWEINSIITLETPQYWGPMDEGTDAAGVGPLPVSPPANSPIRLEFLRKDLRLQSSRRGVGIPYFSHATNSTCAAQAFGRGWRNGRGFHSLAESVRLLRQWEAPYASSAAGPVR